MLLLTIKIVSRSFTIEAEEELGSFFLYVTYMRFPVAFSLGKSTEFFKIFSEKHLR